MCGRFTQTQALRAVAGRFEVTAAPAAEVVAAAAAPRYNIAPTQSVLVVVDDGRRVLAVRRWGLVPAWARDPAIGARLINARAESLRDKPAFREAFRHRRCLVIADGFYEWQRLGPRKQPLRIVLADEALFGMAGLWEEWRSPTGERRCTCTIITTAANALLRPVHDRMPVILPAAAEAAWLDPRVQDPDRLQPLLAPYPAAQMRCYPVSPVVNAPGHDTPECIAPLAR